MCVLNLLIRALAARAQASVTPEQTAEIGEERATATRGLTESATLSVGNGDGAFGGSSIKGPVDDIAGRNPLDVCAGCFFAATGTGPVRPLAL